jgi:hypothetical protein
VTITEFTVGIPDEALADLQCRLDRTRWPHRVNREPWADGADLAYMKRLADYWRTGFDWRAAERVLNRHPQ